ncbi:MAG: amidase, partial [Betaproteobacteria bacterium]|nr:amidase [Betaproteobacteria bacterium]
MSSPDPSRLSATEAAAAIAAKRLTSEALVTACLERVDERENGVSAWAFIDRKLALNQARERD